MATLRRLAAHRTLRGAAGVVTLTLVVSAMAIAESRADPAPQAHATRSAGALSISDSRADRAILTGRRMLPTESVSGSVTITNSGSRPGLFELSSAGLTDTPGADGRALSGDLQLVVDDVTAPARPQRLYDGRLDDLDVVSVGEIAAGAGRTFAFRVTRLADPRPGAYRAARAEVEFDWTALAEEPGRCANRILGSQRADTLSGSSRGDTISGGAGNDLITGLGGEDCLQGEGGDDVIDARDGQADSVDCGPGDDTVYADPQDAVVNCEHVHVGPPATP